MTEGKKFRRTYVMGDIHGDLDSMLDRFDDFLNDGMDLTKDLFVQLGDIIDGGKDSAACVEFLRNVQKLSGEHVVVLLGNHEWMLLRAIGRKLGERKFDLWWKQGGAETYRSYFPEFQRDVDFMQSEAFRQVLICFQPVEGMMRDVAWFKSLPTLHETDDAIFVHAGLLDGSPDNTPTFERLWIRKEFHESNYDWGKVVVYGHTARHSILDQGNKIGVDTKWHGSGFVGGVCLEDGRLVKSFTG